MNVCKNQYLSRCPHLILLKKICILCALYFPPQITMIFQHWKEQKSQHRQRPQANLNSHNLQTGKWVWSLKAQLPLHWGLLPAAFLRSEKEMGCQVLKPVSLPARKWGWKSDCVKIIYMGDSTWRIKGVLKYQFFNE